MNADLDHLKLAREKFLLCLEGISDKDAEKRILPMNSISWIVGHLANQEAAYWIKFAQGNDPFPSLNELVGYGKPASTPPFQEMLGIWKEVTGQADLYLQSLTHEKMLKHFEYKGKRIQESIGTLLFRNIYHYWFHLGEAHAIRQQLGHENLPDFVGSLDWFEYK